ncbi:MAG: ABC transporter ATP-binding protein [Clostridiales bacterium]|nr:ABC transporter ATP-binding protein [Clostridiales bacterium]
MAKKEKKKAPLIHLLDCIRLNDKTIFILCLIYTLVSLIEPIFPIALPKVMIDYLTGTSPNNRGIVWIALGFFIFYGLFSFLKHWLNYYSYPRMLKLRMTYISKQIDKLLNMDYKYMESAKFFDERELAFASTNSNENGVEGIYHKLYELPQLVLTILVLSVFIGLASPFILIALIINIAITSWVAIAVNKYEYKKKEQLSKHSRRVNYYAKTAKDFSYGKDVRLYDLKERILDNFNTEIKGYIGAFKLIKNREYALGFLSLLTLLLSDICTYGILTYLVIKGMPIADFSMYIIATSTLSIKMTNLSENITYIMREYMYVKDLFKFLDENLVEDDGERLAVPGDIPLEVEFSHVTFKYPDTDNNIFEDFSLKIPAGQKLALVGINGAGKTTFVKLLTGLFTPDSGRILINGHDIREYKKSELYKMFAVVFQDVNILAYTIAENIACSQDNIDYDKVNSVLKQVGLYDKIQGLPKGVNTMLLKIIDEEGTVLSGGESQKLAIARALYKGGNCVIMDEPTAALDALAEQEIYEEFDALTKTKTSIYISHRLASTKFCDVIAMIDGTGLIEYGSHDELMKLGGEYYKMFITQGKYYQEGGALA